MEFCCKVDEGARRRLGSSGLRKIGLEERGLEMLSMYTPPVVEMKACL